MTNKVYNKGLELLKHDRSNLRYIENLIDFCNQVGIVRHETMFRERYLNRNGLKPWCKMTQENILGHYLKEMNKMYCRMQTDSTIDELPATVRATYYAYKNGDNLEGMKRSTFYRHRSMLLQVGIDISAPINVTTLNVKPQIIELAEVSIPEFYKVA